MPVAHQPRSHRGKVNKQISDMKEKISEENRQAEEKIQMQVDTEKRLTEEKVAESMQRNKDKPAARAATADADADAAAALYKDGRPRDIRERVELSL